MMYGPTAPPAAGVRMECPHALAMVGLLGRAYAKFHSPVCQPPVISNPHCSHSIVPLFSRRRLMHSNGLCPFLSPLPSHLSLLAGEWLLHPLNSRVRDISPGGSWSVVPRLLYPQASIV
jgi:hypothetical protein